MNVISRVKRSLRAKVIIGVILSLSLILCIFIAIEYSWQRKAILEDLSVLAAFSGSIIEANLHQAMLQSDFDTVQAVLDVIGESEEFRAVYLFDTTGKIIFSSNREAVGTHLDNTQPDCQPCHKLAPEARPESIIVTADDGQRIFRSMQPVENGPECQECHDNEDRLRGLLLIDIPVAPVEESLQANLRENILWGVGSILCTVVVINFTLSRLVLRRLESLAAAIKRFGQGRTLPLLPETQPDELGQLASTFNAMVGEIQIREADNQALAESLRRRDARRGELLKRIISAQEDERKRVARELHDELGQALSGLAVRAEAMGQYISSDPDQALDKLEQIRTLTKQTTHRMYELIWDLRPSALDDLGLVVAIDSYAKRLLDDTDIRFTLDADELKCSLNPEIETALYRILQEALNNVIRHANASQISITLYQKDDSCEVVVTDNGRGFNLSEVSSNGKGARGLGLLGMQERVMQCSGQIEILSQPGHGTRIRIIIPQLEESDG
jgi:signal transduction histidine kinase